MSGAQTSKVQTASIRNGLHRSALETRDVRWATKIACFFQVAPTLINHCCSTRCMVNRTMIVPDTRWTQLRRGGGARGYSYSVASDECWLQEQARGKGRWLSWVLTVLRNWCCDYSSIGIGHPQRVSSRPSNFGYYLVLYDGTVRSSAPLFIWTRRNLKPCTSPRLALVVPNGMKSNRQISPKPTM